jgi:hypothetical protein
LLDKFRRNIEDYHDVDLTEDSHMTLGEWLDRWLSEYKADTVRPGTLWSYRTLIEQYIKPQPGAFLAIIEKDEIRSQTNSI